MAMTDGTRGFQIFHDEGLLLSIYSFLEWSDIQSIQTVFRWSPFHNSSNPSPLSRASWFQSFLCRFLLKSSSLVYHGKYRSSQLLSVAKGFWWDEKQGCLIIQAECFRTGRLYGMPISSLEELDVIFRKQSIPHQRIVFRSPHHVTVFLREEVLPWWNEISSYQEGQQVDILDDRLGIWQEGIIRKKEKDSLLVHYRQWSDTFDERIYSTTIHRRGLCHLAPAYHFVDRWRDKLRVGSQVDVCNPHGGLWHEYILEDADMATLTLVQKEDRLAPAGMHTRTSCFPYFVQHFLLSSRILSKIQMTTTNETSRGNDRSGRMGNGFKSSSAALSPLYLHITWDDHYTTGLPRREGIMGGGHIIHYYLTTSSAPPLG